MQFHSLLDRDFVLLLYLPVAVSALLAVTLRRRVAWPVVLGASLASLLLLAVVLARSWASIDVQAIQSILCFVVLPLSAVMLAAQLDAVRRRRWLLLPLGPSADLLACILAVNLWIWLGNAI